MATRTPTQVRAAATWLACLLVASGTAIGCGQSNTDLRIDDIAPRTASVGEQPWLRVQGAGFVRLQVNLNRSGHKAVSRLSRLQIGAVEVAPADFEILSPRTLRFRLPPLLEPGNHPVTLHRSDGATAQDANGVLLVMPGSPGLLTSDGGPPLPLASPGVEVPDSGPAASLEPELDSVLARPFAAIRRLQEISSPDLEEDDPAFSSDGLELYFSRQVPGDNTTSDLFRSVRSSRDVAWEEPTPVSKINTPHNDATPWLSSDGLTLYFGSERSGSPITTWFATRVTPDAEWEQVTPLEIEPEFGYWGSSLSADSLELVFVSSRMGDWGLFNSRRASIESPWQPPQELVELNSPAKESSAQWFGDELVMASDRNGNADLFVTKRQTGSDLFTRLVPIFQLNTEADETDATFTADGRAMIFASNREGEFDLYEATR